MFKFFTLFYLLNIEKLSPSLNLFSFKKYFYQKELLTNLSSPHLSNYEKLKNIKEYEKIFEDTTYVPNLWKYLDI